MVPLPKKRLQGFRRHLSIKLLVTLVGAVCLGINFLIVAPIHAASGSSASPQQISGGGCETFNGAETSTAIKVCISTNQMNQVVSNASVRLSDCSVTVTIKLFDNKSRTGLLGSTITRGCGDFNGPVASIQPKNIYRSQVLVCSNNDPAACSVVPSPELKIS